GRGLREPPMSFGKLELRYPDGRMVTVELGKRQMAVGRASDVDVVVNDGQVSRRHAVLLCGPEGVRLVDAGSANGTYLGANRLPANQPIPLADGAVLRMGQTLLRFVAARGETVVAPEPPAPSAPAAPTAILRPDIDTAINGPGPGRRVPHRPRLPPPERSRPSRRRAARQPLPPAPAAISSICPPSTAPMISWAASSSFSKPSSAPSTTRLATCTITSTPR